MAKLIVKRFTRTPSLLEDVKANLAAYNDRVAEWDERPAASSSRLLNRIDERQGFLDGTKRMLDSRAAGGDARRIDEIRRQIDKELVDLDTVRGLVEQAETQGVFVGLPLEHLLHLVRDGVNTDAILVGVATGMAALAIRQITPRYAELGIPFNAHTVPSQLFCHANKVGDRKLLGSGAMNTVWLLQYKDPLTGVIHEMVFKPESTDPDIPPDFMAHGIGCEPKLKKLSDGSLAYVPDEAARKPANLPGRAVATYRVDQLLGLNLVPLTAFSEDGEVGTVMKRAPGTSPLAMGKVRLSLDPDLAEWLKGEPDVLAEYATAQGYSGASIETGGELVLSRPSEQGANAAILRSMDFDAPRLRENLTKLQWLDALCGQLDRNPQNYFVDGDMNVYAIDNDQSFGSVTTQFGKDNCPSLPKVISNDLRGVLMRLDESALRATLSPLLAPAEVEAAVERLHLIQAELAKTGDEAVQVISTPDEWSSEGVGNLLGVVVPGPDGRLSNDDVERANGAGYLGRDRANVQDKRWVNQQESVAERRTPIFDPAEVRSQLEQRRQAADA